MLVSNERPFIFNYAKPILSLLVLILLIPIVTLGGSQAVRLFSQAQEIPANISVNVNQSQGTLSRPWAGLSQGGEQDSPGQLVSLAPVTAQIKSLNIKYVRIDHLLEEPFWQNHLARIQEITATGATPFISLSYFPQGAADSDVGTVANWDLWQSRVTQLVGEVSGRSGLNLSSVYYEVWNEPDGPTFGNFQIGEGKDYFTLYQKTVAAALAAPNTNAFKIGGPALADLRRCTNGLLFVCQQFWLDKFLGLVSVNHTRLDFISWHRYSERLSDYQSDVNFTLSLYNKYPQLPPAEKIITEWGSDPAQNPIHNTAFDAAHLVAAARTFIGYVDLATKFEVRDGPTSADKGWGIFDYAGNAKPTAAALKLLNLLRSERLVVSGEGTNVTGIASRDTTGVTLIISNYDQAAQHEEIVPVAITGLSRGTYRLTKWTINSLHPLGVQSVNNLSIAGSYGTSETMLPNSVVLYDLQLTGI